MVIFVVFVESYYDYKGTGALLGPPGLPTPAPTGDGVGIPSSRGFVWFPRLLVRRGLPAIVFFGPRRARVFLLTLSSYLGSWSVFLLTPFGFLKKTRAVLTA